MTTTQQRKLTTLAQFAAARGLDVGHFMRPENIVPTARKAPRNVAPAQTAKAQATQPARTAQAI